LRRWEDRPAESTVEPGGRLVPVIRPGRLRRRAVGGLCTGGCPWIASCNAHRAVQGSSRWRGTRHLRRGARRDWTWASLVVGSRGTAHRGRRLAPPSRFWSCRISGWPTLAAGPRGSCRRRDRGRHRRRGLFGKPLLNVAVGPILGALGGGVVGALECRSPAGPGVHCRNRPRTHRAARDGTADGRRPVRGLDAKPIPATGSTHWRSEHGPRSTTSVITSTRLRS
jgi:hypothetical protein